MVLIVKDLLVYDNLNEKIFKIIVLYYSQAPLVKRTPLSLQSYLWSRPCIKYRLNTENGDFTPDKYLA